MTIDFVLNIFQTGNIEEVSGIAVVDVLVQSEPFSTKGEIDSRSLKECLTKLKQAGKYTILDWNIFCKNTDIAALDQIFKQINSVLDAVRFSDPGVGLFLKNTYPDIQLQYNMEHGQHNRNSIYSWIDVFSPALTRIVLSNQIPLPQLEDIIQGTKLEKEVKGLGRIPLFYSARKLIPREFNIDDLPARTFSVASLDRPDQISLIMQTHHGTTMFHDRNLDLLGHIREMETVGITHVGIEFDKDEQYGVLAESYPGDSWIQSIQDTRQKPTTEGFFSENQTQSSLAVLNNEHTQGEMENKVGIVLESTKDSHCLVNLQKPVNLPKRVEFVSPEGNRVTFELNRMRSIIGAWVENTAQPGIYIFPWLKHVVPGTVILFQA